MLYLIPVALGAIWLLSKKKGTSVPRGNSVDPQETVAKALVSGERTVSVQTLLGAGFTEAAEQLKGVA